MCQKLLDLVKAFKDRSIEHASAQLMLIRCSQYIVIEIFDCNFNDLELGEFKPSRSKVILPIESPLVVSYLTSIVSNVVSRTGLEIFDANIM